MRKILLQEKQTMVQQQIDSLASDVDAKESMFF